MTKLTYYLLTAQGQPGDSLIKKLDVCSLESYIIGFKNIKLMFIQQSYFVLSDQT